MHTVRYTSDADCLRVIEGARYFAPHRVALRRLLAYLAIRFGNAWLSASADVLEGYLPPQWQTMPHHRLIAYLTASGVTPEHCTLA